MRLTSKEIGSIKNVFVEVFKEGSIYLVVELMICKKVEI